MTDNRNRTVAEVRHAFGKCGGNLGTSSSVAFQFHRTTRACSAIRPAATDRIMEVALEAGADDVISNDDGSVDVLTAPALFQTVREAMLAAGLKPEEAEITQRASSAPRWVWRTRRKWSNCWRCLKIWMTPRTCIPTLIFPIPSWRNSEQRA